MKRVRLTIKNYRGFADAEPVRIDIAPGFTAMLGRNNSGKSSIKLFFYELRGLFESLTRGPNQQHAPNVLTMFQSGFSVPFAGITDPLEVFNNTNQRPLSFEIEVLEPKSHGSVDSLVRVVATCNRQRPGQWTFALFGRTQPSVNLQQHGPQPHGPTTVHLRSGGLVVDCSDFMETMTIFRDARYFGPFRNAINQGSGEHFDLKVGTAFIDLWDSWKTSGQKSLSRAIDQVTEDIRSLFEFARLEINASHGLKTLIVSIDGQAYRLGELGSGLTQFIMVLGNAATMRPSLLLVDEPETNLHPSLQIDFLLALAQYAHHGCLFSTHSVGLARSVADRIYSFQRNGPATVVCPFEATPDYLEFIGELSFSTFKELGSDRLLLVEGVNDVKVMQQLLRTVRKEHTTVILPLGGDQLARGGREAELKELTRLSSNICALVDSERGGPDEKPIAHRAEFEKTCRHLGFDVCLTQRRSI